jgi:signal transduction histidine kinase
MPASRLTTRFAPPERLSKPLALEQAQTYPRPKMLQEMMDAVPQIVVVLNHQRQVIFTNQALLDLLGKQPNDVVGSRPGELLDCIHATENEAGCGTTEFCQLCGAVNAILTSQKGTSDTRECRINQANGSALDLRVSATPLEINGELFTIFTVADIGHEKRRRALERIFFHDILNTAGGLRNLSELLKGASADEVDDLMGLVYQVSDMLIDEIMAQRTLSAAENAELAVNPVDLNSVEVLSDVVSLYANREISTARSLLIDPAANNMSFTSDKALVKRVLGNMLKNALEASRPGETISTGCRDEQGQVCFWVKNQGYMRRDVQLQVFQRSFSTKGAGRGLGTYSIKLLTEQYLQGIADFTSTPENGTTFFITLPYVLLK